MKSEVICEGMLRGLVLGPGNFVPASAVIQLAQINKFGSRVLVIFSENLVNNRFNLQLA